MNPIKFLSSGVNVPLPTPIKPKVYLAIDNSTIAKQSFKLYNPFSRKARFLKLIFQFLCVHCNPIAKKLLPTVTNDTAEFIRELETKLDIYIYSSVYVATAEDKFVLQLQNENGIIGYVKLAISLIGSNRIVNEKKAIDILSSTEIIPKILFEGHYKDKPYIILENLEGTINWVADDHYKKVLDTFKKGTKFRLKNHPRILSLISRLESKNLQGFVRKLESEIENSTKIYAEVYEHGDFAPWNLIEVNNKIVPFDFEYFEENGLEYLDEIKYHFQVNHLMCNKSGEALIKSIAHQIRISEFGTIFLVFLLKEILVKIELNEPYILESSLLNLLPLKS